MLNDTETKLPNPTPERELDLRSDSIEEKLREAISKKGMLLICSDGSLGGRSSVVSAMLRKKEIPAYYLVKGFIGLANLPEEKRQNIILLLKEFPILLLYPTPTEVESLLKEQKTTFNQVIASLANHPHAHYLKSDTDRLPGIDTLLEEYKRVTE